MKKLILLLLVIIGAFSLGFYSGNKTCSEKNQKEKLLNNINSQFKFFIKFYIKKIEKNKKLYEELRKWYFDINGYIVQDINDNPVSFNFMERMNG